MDSTRSASLIWSRRNTTKRFRLFTTRSGARSTGLIRCTTRRWPMSRRATIGPAIRAYQEAIRLTPQYSYLPYNLGLVYQRLNRRKDAETAYLKGGHARAQFGRAIQRAGHIEGLRGQASRSRAALSRGLAEESETAAGAAQSGAAAGGRERTARQEAIDLWRENLRQSPDYLPSRLSLAGALAAQGDNAGADRRIPQGAGGQARLRCGAHRAGRCSGQDQRSRRRARSASSGNEAGFAGSGAV